MADLWYIDWAEYGRMASAFSRKISAKRKRFDLVIGIARGGVPLAMVIADKLGVKVDIINVKSYTGIGKEERTKPRILSTLTDGIKGGRILLVDDLVEHGDTMKLVSAYIRKRKPKELRTAVLFKKPWSKFEPDYFLRKVDRWVVFPWDKGETRRLMLQNKTKSF